MEEYKRVELKCCKCGKPVDTKGELWLMNDALVMHDEQQYICNHCIDGWKRDYEVISCEFEVTDIDTVAHTQCRMGKLSVSTQALRLPSQHRTINVPPEFDREILSRLEVFKADRSKILEEQRKQSLKYVDFMDDEWEGHYFNCETRDGDIYERIVFKLDPKNQIIPKPGQDIPELVLRFVQQELNRRLGR
jgi:hypothetical protein